MITRFVSVSVRCNIYVMSIIILFQILFLPFKFITIDSLLSIEWNLCFVEKPLLSKWQFVYFLSFSSCKLSVLEIFMKKITTIRKLISSMIYCIDTTWLIYSFNMTITHKCTTVYIKFTTLSSCIYTTHH